MTPSSASLPHLKGGKTNEKPSPEISVLYYRWTQGILLIAELAMHMVETVACAQLMTSVVHLPGEQTMVHNFFSYTMYLYFLFYRQ